MNQAGAALGRIGGADQVSKNTYALRLEKVSNILEHNIECLEDALQRAHGTPGTPREAEGKNAVTPVAPISVSLERIESQVRRFSELVTSVEEIA